MNDCDVIIVGGGMVGLVLALLLAERDFRIVLLEHVDPLKKNASPARVSAINLASKQLLQDLNLWSQMAKDSYSALERLVVWDGIGSGRIEFSAADVGLLELGSIITNSVLIKHIWQRLLDHPKVKLVLSQPVSLQVTENFITLELLNGDVLQAALCVGADGAHSFVRAQMQVSLQERSYEQQAIIAVVKTALPHEQTGWQVFLPEGPLALLPLADLHHCAIVWSSARALSLMAMEDALFEEALNQAMGLPLGEISAVIDRQSFPLIMRHALRYVAPRLALVGDAAHTIHPLAGQGVNLGFADVVCLADALCAARQKNKNIGLLSVLRRYERARRGDNTAMLLMMRGINDLFATESSLIVQARSLGLNAVDRFSFLKNYFIGRALGCSRVSPLK